MPAAYRFTLLLVICNMVRAGDSGRATDAISGNVPEAVRMYMSGTFDEHLAEARAYAKVVGKSFDPDLTLLYFVNCRSTQTGDAAWLVGYRIGRDGHEDVDRAVVLNATGNELFKLPEAIVAGEAAVFQNTPTSQAVAMGWAPTRYRQGYVTVITLDPHPRELLRYSGQPDELWESTLYLLPFNAGHHGEIIAERQVLRPDGSAQKTVYIKFSWNPKAEHFDAGVTINEPAFKQLRQQSISTGGGCLKQWGPIIESHESIKN